MPVHICDTAGVERAHRLEGEASERDHALANEYTQWRAGCQLSGRLWVESTHVQFNQVRGVSSQL